MDKNVILQGYLTKAPPMKKISEHTMSRWHRRFFVLDGASKTLQYFAEPSCKSLKGTIRLTDITNIGDYVSHPKHPHMFSVAVANRMYFFAADSAQESLNWRAALGEQIAELQQAESGGSSKTMRTIDATPACLFPPDPVECYSAKSSSGRKCTLRLGDITVEEVDPETNNVIHSFPLEFVRSYGQTNRRFCLEAGQRCPQGAGLHNYIVADGVNVADRLDALQARPHHLDSVASSASTMTSRSWGTSVSSNVPSRDGFASVGERRQHDASHGGGGAEDLVPPPGEEFVTPPRRRGPGQGTPGLSYVQVDVGPSDTPSPVKRKSQLPMPYTQVDFARTAALSKAMQDIESTDTRDSPLRIDPTTGQTLGGWRTTRSRTLRGTGGPELTPASFTMEESAVGRGGSVSSRDSVGTLEAPSPAGPPGAGAGAPSGSADSAATAAAAAPVNGGRPASMELVAAVQTNQDVIRSLEDEINDLLGELEMGMQVASSISDARGGAMPATELTKPARRRYENVDLP